MGDIVIKQPKKARFSYNQDEYTPELGEIESQCIAASVSLLKPDEAGREIIRLCNGEIVFIKYPFPEYLYANTRLRSHPEVCILVKAILPQGRECYIGGETGEIAFDVLYDLKNYPFDTPISIGLHFTLSGDSGDLATGIVTDIKKKDPPNGAVT